jgi:hypothetical protein
LAKSRHPRRNKSRNRPPRQARESQPTTAATGTVPKRRSKAMAFVGAAVATVLVLSVGALWQFLNEEYTVKGSSPHPAPTPLNHVGSDACATCHQAEAQLWRTSQRRHAMAHATEESVLSDLADARFEYYGVRSGRFARHRHQSRGLTIGYCVRYNREHQLTGSLVWHDPGPNPID